MIEYPLLNKISNSDPSASNVVALLQRGQDGVSWDTFFDACELGRADVATLVLDRLSELDMANMCTGKITRNNLEPLNYVCTHHHFGRYFYASRGALERARLLLVDQLIQRVPACLNPTWPGAVSPLELAMNNVRLATYLLDNGADLTAPVHALCLGRAMNKRSTSKLIPRMLAMGAPANIDASVFDISQSPLFRACQLHRLDVVRLLLQYKASLVFDDPRKRTFLTALALRSANVSARGSQLRQVTFH